MKFSKTAAALLFASALGAAPAVAADAPAKPQVLHTFLSTSETGLDPAVASDIATLSLLENLFDPLMRYDYLARPLKLRGNTLEAMPEVSRSRMARRRSRSLGRGRQS